MNEFQRIRQAEIDNNLRLTLLSDMCSANALATVKRAGSGHLGSSFSSLDIVTYLYHFEMNIAELGVDHPDRDIYFSSKGHDVPGQYAVLHSLGLLSEEQLFFKPHRSFLINLKFVKQLVKKDGGYILMENDQIISISKENRETLLAVMSSL